jgi:hypothetical protein
MGGGFDRDPGKHNPARDAEPVPAMSGSGPGKQTLTGALSVQLSASPSAADHSDGGAVQQAAAQGVAGAGGALPHGEAIQRLFGHHDVGGIEAHVGGAAATASRSIGAEAYATGNRVAFASSPSLHTAAHEAAHVVQQRGGVQLKGGVGESGDAHEQHADAVADAVVQGRSAEALLERSETGGGDPDGSAGGAGGKAPRGIDPYAGGGGGGRAVQRQTPNMTPADPAAADPAAVAAAIHELDGVPTPSFAGVQDGTFSIDGVTGWIDAFGKTLADARTVAATGSSPELAQAVDRCLATHAPEMQQIAEQLRTATVDLANASSVAKKDPAKAVFPTQEGVKKLSAAATLCTSLARDAAMPGGAPGKAQLTSAASTTQDASLAMLQSLSVSAARERWTKGKATETPDAAKAGTGARTELDDIFKDAGWSDRVNKDENGRIYDWCGMFVVSSYFKGAGMASQLRAGFYHTDNVKDFFQYQQAHNADRAPASIWADGQWWGLHDYHEQRGSVRLWTPRATIQAALQAGTAPDIRPGDTCLIDHSGGNSPGHIVMVESYDAATKTMVTIEGNTFGVHADKDGKAERLDDDHLKSSTQGSGTAAGIHERDMSTLAPGPTTYTVKDASSYVRQDDDLTQFKMDGVKKVALPVGSSVVITEVKDSAGAKYGHLQDGGWTKMTNLTKAAAAALPKGAAKPNAGATVWGVGRPSMIDFEDGHEYAIHAVPAELQHTSPADIKELARKKDKAGQQAKAVGVKK